MCSEIKSYIDEGLDKDKVEGFELEILDNIEGFELEILDNIEGLEEIKLYENREEELEKEIKFLKENCTFINKNLKKVSISILELENLRDVETDSSKFQSVIIEIMKKHNCSEKIVRRNFKVYKESSMYKDFSK